MATGRLPDPNSSPLTAKGDLYTYSTVPAKLAVGNNGETLVADSSASTGLRWQSNFAAGKNAIINGDFRINQRNFTSQTDVIGYKFDRWRTENGTANLTASAQTFTPGAAPVAGYEAVNFMRMATTTANNANEYALLQQFIEDVRIFAGQTITVSFWAKASSGTPKIGVSLDQIFGSGGSSVVNGTGQSFTLSTSWARYSGTFAIPSISGKTIGTGSYLQLLFWITAGSNFNSRSGSVGPQSVTLDVWGVQVEAGNVATTFQTATGTLAGELAACQRYYNRLTNTVNQTLYAHTGINTSSTRSFHYLALPVSMRTTPSIAQSGAVVGDTVGSNYSVSSIAVYAFANTSVSIDVTHATGYSASVPVFLAYNQNGYIELSAEL